MRERLAAFLPALRAANERLVLEEGAGRGFEILDAEKEEDDDDEGNCGGKSDEGKVGEEGQYIEMVWTRNSSG